MTLLRRLRGVLGLGVIWGALWAAIFVALVGVVGIFRPGDIGPGEGPLDVWRTGGLVGLVSGAAFGVLLALAESGKALRAIPRGRAALWGLLATTVFPLATAREDQVLLFGPIGALLAVVAVSIARAGKARPLGLLLGSSFIADAVAPRREPAT